MPVGADWSKEEVRAVVRSYMSMLKYELAGQAYNKTEHRRALLPLLDGRSEGSIELKHQNISAVLRDLGHFWIPGYKPRANYQSMLAQEVGAWIRINPDLDRHAIAAAEALFATPEHLDFVGFEVERPPRKEAVAEGRGAYGAPSRVPRIHDYVAREARNSSLGKAGEELVVKYEQHRLSRLGKDRLAGKVEHVSLTQGDGLGFDVLSFDTKGRERFIEVKTTAFARETPFFASSSEVGFAKRHADQYALYRVFEFKKSPRCFVLAGAIEEHCALDPVSFRCVLA